MSDSKKLPARPRAPREHLVLVGGPSNMFNGFIYWDASNRDRDPEWGANGRPEDLDDVTRYVSRGPNGEAVGTHDLYWGNFVTPIPRLVATGKIRPREGDLITILVAIEPYERRIDADWAASPHNPRWAGLHRDLHPRSPFTGLRELPTAASRGPKPPPPPPSPHPVGEDRINHEIFMRVTGGNDDAKGYIRRPRRPQHYLDVIHDLPKRIVFGSGWTWTGSGSRLPRGALLSGVLVKLLLIRDVHELETYLRQGRWPGEQETWWMHPLDRRHEEDFRGAALGEGANWDFAATRPPKWALRYWERMPEVDRATVKVASFHYIGHSSHEGLYLSYGWSNPKGKLPFPDGNLEPPGLTKIFGSTRRRGVDAITAPDAKAVLWGCHLGLTLEMLPPPKDPSEVRLPTVADVLIPHFAEVVGATGATQFHRILDDDTALPVPAEHARWVTHANR